MLEQIKVGSNDWLLGLESDWHDFTGTAIPDDIKILISSPEMCKFYNEVGEGLSVREMIIGMLFTNLLLHEHRTPEQEARYSQQIADC
jgi:hypothetical protein